MDKKHCKTIIWLVLLTMTFMVVSISSALAASPTVDKTTVIIRANTVYHSFDKGSTFKWGWLPMLDFRINGPVASGSVVSFEMTTPDGKPWVSFDYKITAVKEGESLKVEDCGRELPKDKLSSALGQYSFKINLKNELQGTNQTLFSGKFKVGRVFYGDVPQDKDNYKWYVDYDWALPIGEVYAIAEEQTYGGVVERKAKPLAVSFWFRGPAHDATAYLFYNGKEIANTETTSQGVANGEQGVTLFDKPGVTCSWVKNRYTFTHVLVSNSEERDNDPDAFRMDKNPGEYEVKVLRNGKLARTMKFTVGANGKIVDNGVSRENELGTRRLTFFASVIGDEGGRKPDKEAWRTGAFYGNPLKGFGQ